MTHTTHIVMSPLEFTQRLPRWCPAAPAPGASQRDDFERAVVVHSVFSGAAAVTGAGFEQRCRKGAR